MPRFGQGRGFPRIGQGGVSYCRCPVCGYEEEHGKNVRCYRIQCPHCGTYMEEY